MWHHLLRVWAYGRARQDRQTEEQVGVPATTAAGGGGRAQFAKAEMPSKGGSQGTGAVLSNEFVCQWQPQSAKEDLSLRC